MRTKIKGVLAKRVAIGKGWIAFLLFGSATLIGGLIGSAITGAVGLSSVIGPLGILGGFIVVYPVSYLLYRFLAKRFAHQQVG